MSRRNHLAAICAAIALTAMTHRASAVEISLCTDHGAIIIALDEVAAPLHAANFVDYVERGHYNGTVFHRVISDFMIQAGGYNRQLQARPGTQSVTNESKNGASNARGTIAAARTADPHSAAAQFFINVADNRRLDGNSNDWGYTVFGEVIQGMDVVDTIAALPTGSNGPFPTDVPDPLVTIQAANLRDLAVLGSVDGPDLEASLLARIAAAQEMSDPTAALEWLNHYRSTCAPIGADLLLDEAENAMATEQLMRARFALEEFFATTSTEHPRLADARMLYAELVPNETSNTTRPFRNCAAPTPPNVPDGTRAALEGMVEGQSAVQAFMRASTSYLECLDVIIESSEDSPETRQATVIEYNRMVDVTQALGEAFNEQVRAFRARQ